MPAKVLFAPVTFDRYDADATLPAKFARLLNEMPFEPAVKGKITAVKMHLGRHIGYSTIHPLFVKLLIDRLKACGANVFITDQIVSGSRERGYAEEYLGCPIVAACGFADKYYYEKNVSFKTFKNVDVAGHIHDAEVMIDLSHVKGHGVCGYGGAVKNIAMGCVSHRTRMQLHALEGGLFWDADKCTHCGACVNNCNHDANGFDKNGRYQINFHHCTYCQHCVKVCPTGAIKMDTHRYEDFQTGMALCTEKCLETYAPGSVFYINFLTNITALCDCWGFTTPSIVPDIGVLASSDIVAVEKVSLDMIKTEDFLPSGVPVGYELGESGHLLERIHGKSPFVQLDALEKLGLGGNKYELVTVK